MGRFFSVLVLILSLFLFSAPSFSDGKGKALEVLIRVLRATGLSMRNGTLAGTSPFLIEEYFGMVLHAETRTLSLSAEELSLIRGLFGNLAQEMSRLARDIKGGDICFLLQLSQTMAYDATHSRAATEKIELRSSSEKYSLKEPAQMMPQKWGEEGEIFSDSSVQEILGKGIEAYQSGDYEVALAYLEEGAALSPRLADIHFWLGEVYHSRGAFGEAMGAYERSILFNRQDTRAYYRLGEIYFKKGNPATASDYMQQVIAMDPDHIEAWLLLAKCSFRLSKLKRQLQEGEREMRRARVSLEEIVSRRPQKMEALHEVADLYFEMGSERAIELDFEPLFLTPWERSFLQEAIGLYRRVIELAGEGESYFRGASFASLADAYHLLRLFEAEAGVLEEMIAGEPCHQKRYRLGRLYSMMGQPEKAIRVLEPYAGFSSSPDVQIDLALAYATLGKYRNALNILEETFKRMSARSHLRIRALIAQMNVHLGKGELALEEYYSLRLLRAEDEEGERAFRALEKLLGLAGNSD